ncbi:zinc-binding dehydrogenase [Chelatococcus reniformis]|uniref:Alcohol dehydrogenase n=1 Tax=Chelatococcus reniformis TaxID=1494448 RepID=A0A916UTM0_9HYPH|nr:zinc-binding dehydrogenase [Chelatococcus reniformis]GGC87310.1 alcohol dehydrogenase [Chelatococcus reniformis]
MKAVVRRQRRLVLDEGFPEPVPGTGQVLARSLACGICGSDLHGLEHLEELAALAQRCGSATTLDGDKDVVFGHEFCAEVIEAGPGSSGRIRPGTRVVAMPFCAGPGGMELVGFSNRFPGAFAERLLLTEALLLPVPEHLSDILACLTEPFAVGEHAVATARLDGDAVVLVLGCGPIGLATVAAAKLRGIGPVVACDFSPARRQLAETIGADIVIDPAVDSPYGRWETFDVPATLASRSVALATGRMTRPATIFECVGKPGMLQAVIDGAPPGSRIVVVGACMQSDAIEPLMAINKQLSFDFVFAYSPEEFAATLANIAGGRIKAGPLVTKVVGLAAVADAFALASRADEHAKIVVDPRL